MAPLERLEVDGMTILGLIIFLHAKGVRLRCYASGSSLVAALAGVMETRTKTYGYCLSMQFDANGGEEKQNLAVR